MRSDFALNRIRVLYGDCSGRTDYDAYFVFDADNVLDPGFVSAMNRGVNRGVPGAHLLPQLEELRFELDFRR